MTTQHHVGEGYSQRNPVPTIERFRQEEEARERAAAANATQTAQSAAEEAAPSKQVPPPVPAKEEKSTPENDPAVDKGGARSGSGGGADEKERLKRAAQPPQEKPTDFVAKGKRRVKDPTTGADVEIEDQKPFNLHPDQLESKKPSAEANSFSGRLPTSADAYRTLLTAPIGAPPTNVLLQPFPAPLDSEGLAKLRGNFRNLGIALGVAMSVVWFMTAFGAGYWRFFVRSILIGGVGLGGGAALGLAANKIETDLKQVRAQMATQRGQGFSPKEPCLPEGVEWINAVIATVWKQIDPAIFATLADTIEDVMQASLPGFIEAVKISDLTHGDADSALRFTHFRALADKQGDREYPREEWIDQGKKPSPSADDKAGEKPKPVENDADGDGIADEDESGDFLNLEVGFVLMKRPDQKAKAASLQISFFLGALNLFRFPFNVWAEVTGLSGVVRLRVQFVAAAPFVRNVTISLMGVPDVAVNVVPGSRALPNVLDLPMVSGFVKSAIAAACAEYCAPKSLTMNVGDMLAGAPANSDVDAVGVLVVHIQRGIDLSAQDASGSSDPYVIVSLAKFGKPLYSSRIIFEDLNPNFNEYAFVPVTLDDLRNNEVLSIQLWDSDQRTADDIVGRISRDVRDLTKGETKNRMVDYEDPLKGFEEADKMQGSLKWRGGWFEKKEFDRLLFEQAEARRKEKMTEVEKKAKEAEVKAAQEKAKKEGKAVEDTELTALNTPPSPEYPTGVLQIVVHHIVGLEEREVEKGVSGKARESGASGQDVEEKDLELRLPSGYIELAIDDSIVYKTRTKMATNMPIFEAKTENVVRDWTKSEVRLIVRDARTRELDPIMGIAQINLKEVFENESSVQRYFAISDGIGYGKIQATLIWRSLKLKEDIPVSLLGADTATVELLSAISIDVDEEHESLRNQKISVTTGDVTQKLSAIRKQEDLSIGDDEAENGALARLPVYDRHASTLAFSFGGGIKLGPFGGKVDAVAVVSLLDLEDEEIYELDIPLLAGDKLGTLARNHIDDWTLETHKAQEIGKLKVKVRVDPGLDGNHAAVAKGQVRRHEQEVYERLVGMPETAEKNAHADDDGVIDRKEQKAIDRAKTDALHARHRGAYGYAPVRTGAWAKQGVKDRVRRYSLKLRGKDTKERQVASETGA
ncbi:hypothetical protein IE81DRAFT_336741 [Ceraceosorus guamensis]|uniref:C2 domain-containing protein n=1 Tax=Ceraceosorus guamensis TaxID=1522189 RepID=A0A316W8J0_9BASI|nr:hypothetical protein IE81DRAFT_336741 [Ceraceosorus guamensis]PWN44353.1 hypothetical protein IE81DRAFT_336741 [Ceraceosorus guamensis]